MAVRTFLLKKSCSTPINVGAMFFYERVDGAEHGARRVAVSRSGVVSVAP
jgi:hypothetical protein